MSNISDRDHSRLGGFVRVPENVWENSKAEIESLRAEEAERIAALPTDYIGAIKAAQGHLRMNFGAPHNDDMLYEARMLAWLLSAMLSAKHPYGDPEDEAAAMYGGAQAYVRKPFDRRFLLHTVKLVLHSRQGRPAHRDLREVLEHNAGIRREDGFVTRAI